jgi:hypothetical protein
LDDEVDYDKDFVDDYLLFVTSFIWEGIVWVEEKLIFLSKSPIEG